MDLSFLYKYTLSKELEVDTISKWLGCYNTYSMKGLDPLAIDHRLADIPLYARVKFAAPDNM